MRSGNYGRHRGGRCLIRGRRNRARPVPNSSRQDWPRSSCPRIPREPRLPSTDWAWVSECASIWLRDGGELTVLSSRAPACTHGLVAPLAVDIGRVAEAHRLAALVAGRGLTPSDGLARLEAISRTAPVSLLRFAVMAAAGAAGLSVIFGATDAMTLAAVGASAAPGPASVGVCPTSAAIPSCSRSPPPSSRDFSRAPLKSLTCRFPGPSSRFARAWCSCPARTS